MKKFIACLFAFAALSVANSVFAGDPNDDVVWNRLELSPAIVEYEIVVVTPGQNMNSGGTILNGTTAKIVAQPATGDPKINQGVLFQGLADGNRTVQTRGKDANGFYTQWSTPVTIPWTTTISAAPQNVHEVVN